MRPRNLTAAAVVSVVGLLTNSVAFASHSVSGDYTIGSTPGVSIVCSPDCLGEPGLNIGGYTFDAVDAEGQVPVRIDIADSSSGPVSFTVCQDFNSARCGEVDPVTGQPTEPRVTGCGTTADLTTSAVGFQADKDTSVFIRTASADCAGVALGGTITITYGA